ICLATNGQDSPSITSDGAGGAIMAWSDFRNGVDDDVYAQHILSTGTVDPGWTVNGVSITIAINNQYDAPIAPDGAGGAWVAYSDRRGSGGWADIYVNHVFSNGLIDARIGSLGLAVCIAGQEQSLSKIVSDGAGGAIVTWQDERSFSKDIYAHHV